MDAYDRVMLGLKVLATASVLGLLVAAGALTEQAMTPEPDTSQPAVLYTNPRWQDGETFSLTPCPTEDSVNCYWDASLRGNKIGQSFININGNVYYKPLGEK